MEFLNEILPIILYIVGIILLIVLIILGLKAIKILDGVEEIVEDAQDKLDEFEGAISLLSKTANSFAGISSSIVTGITTAIGKIFSKKLKEEDEDE